VVPGVRPERRGGALTAWREDGVRDLPDRGRGRAGDAGYAAMRGRSRPRQSRVLAMQGVYYLTTGLAPFASRRWFERVTGAKTDWWLVQTVGAVVAVAGAGLTWAAARDRTTPEVVGMAAGWATALAAIDVVYVGRRRIPPTYLLDAVVEIALLTALLGPREGERS
jgi:hypothetical protein